MKNNEEKFCEAYNAFWGNSLTSPQQLKCHAMDGHELQEFCEFYFKENFSFCLYLSIKNSTLLILGEEKNIW